MTLTKQSALTKLFQCAEKYKTNLLGTCLLFVATDKDKNFEFFTATFRVGNFQHLTGVNTAHITARDFFHRCLEKRISPDDIKFNEDGTTALKLEVLPLLMSKNLSANMLSDYSGRNLKLYTEKIVGTVNACIGFVKDAKSGLFVPNTVLRQDMRDISLSVKRIVATFQKTSSEENYSTIVYTAKNFDVNDIKFPEHIKNQICL